LNSAAERFDDLLNVVHLCRLSAAGAFEIDNVQACHLASPTSCHGRSIVAIYCHCVVGAFEEPDDFAAEQVD
jgi:hypothetical protein